MDTHTSKNKNTCSACGTSPVNHSLFLVLSIIDEFLNRIDKRFFKFTEKPFWQKMIIWMEKIIFSVLSFFRIVSFNKDDLEKVEIGRSKIIWEEAQKRGIPVEQIVILGKPTDHFRTKIGGRTYYFNSLPVPPWLPQNGYRWIDDKLKLADELHKANLPAPRTKRVKTLAQAKEAFSQFQKPVIIKPEWGSRGRHTTTNINTMEELEKAFSLARQITRTMVIQEHIPGSVCRATVIDNKLVGFFRADQPKIVGDGVRTVKELIEDKNKTRHPRVSEVLINDDLKNFIGRIGYTTESILPEGEVLILSAKTGRMYGSYTKEMLPEVHPKMYSIFEKVGKLCDAPILGFDLIMADPTKDPEQERWGIIECNSLPFIDLHYMALEGEPINLAKNVWDLWNK